MLRDLYMNWYNRCGVLWKGVDTVCNFGILGQRPAFPLGQVTRWQGAEVTVVLHGADKRGWAAGNQAWPVRR